MDKNKKWMIVIVLGVVLLVLIGVLVFFAVKSCNAEPVNAATPQYYFDGNEIIEISEPDATVPPDAIVGYFSEGEYYSVAPDATIPPDATVVYSNPSDHPDSPTAPPTAAPTQQPTAVESDSPETVEPTSTTQPTQQPSSTDEVGWIDPNEEDEWNEDGAIIIDFSDLEELFGTPNP
ncbi:MAG: hypothetical protein Q4C01_00420 [Clostridia bacterium]|nr:hypothetical protein [Clostridia bacterium]